MPRLLSVNVGRPRDVAWRGKTVHTAVWKTLAQGRRMTRRLDVDGDGQGDLAGHGGEHRAVFVYQIESYRYWQNQLGRNDFTYGQFGENFTVEGLADTEVCIGDHYRIGDALFEVTQPRVTCYRVGIRMNEPQMAALLVSHGRPGFYFRVIEEGEVEAGEEIVQVTAGPERMTIAEANALLYTPGRSRSQLERAVRIPALSAGWRSSFQALLDRERSGSAVTGNPGLTPAAGPPPAWTGFRRLRVSSKDRESTGVTSLVLEPTDGQPLAAALLGLERVVLAGYDWGGRAACIIAALWPERVAGLVTMGGYNIQNIAASGNPASPTAEYRYWYQWYFHTERGRAGLAANRGPLCRLLWELWSPNYRFDDATYERTAASFDNPDFVEVVIQSCRHRHGAALGNPALEAIEIRFAPQPPITVPTISLYRECDGVSPPDRLESHARHFTRPYQSRVIPIARHFLPRETPEAVVEAVCEL